MHSPIWMQNKSAILKETPGIVTIAAATIIFCAAATNHILGGDNAEFVNLSRAAGIAHPPGYPVYVFLLRSFHWLSNSAPRAAALVTAITSGLQLCLLYGACRLWKFKPIYSAIATGVYAISPLSILLSTQAEVFALNNLLACGILLISSPSIPFKGKARASIAGALLGIGLAHHHTIALMSPLIIYTFFLGAREAQDKKKLLLIALFLLSFLGGLSANFGLFYWPDDWVATTSSWPKLESPNDLIRHFFRSQYGTLQLSHNSSASNNLNALSFFGYSLLITWNIFTPFILTSLLGIAKRESWALPEKMWWLTLFSCFILSGPLFIGTTGLWPLFYGGSVIERFYFLPTLLLAPFCALGISQAHQWFLSFYDKRKKVGRLSSLQSKSIGLLTISLTGTILASISMRATERSRANYLESFLINSLANLPHQSIVISHGDSQFFGYPYIQETLGLRKDILIINAGQISDPHSQKALKSRLRRFDLKTNSPVNPREVIRISRESGRATFVSNNVDQRVLYRFLEGAKAKSYPHGPLIRIVNAKERMPSAREIFFLNQQLFSKYDLHNANAYLLDGWRIEPAYAYYKSWQSISNLLKEQGENELAYAAMNYANLFRLCTSPKCLGESVNGESFHNSVNNF